MTSTMQAIPWPMVFDMGLGNSRHDRPLCTLLSQLKDNEGGERGILDRIRGKKGHYHDENTAK